MKKAISPKYLELAKKLKKDEAEKLLSRMTGKLPRRLAHDELSRDDALAIQLELEEERLTGIAVAATPDDERKFGLEGGG